MSLTWNGVLSLCVAVILGVDSGYSQNTGTLGSIVLAWYKYRGYRIYSKSREKGTYICLKLIIISTSVYHLFIFNVELINIKNK